MPTRTARAWTARSSDASAADARTHDAAEDDANSEDASVVDATGDDDAGHEPTEWPLCEEVAPATTWGNTCPSAAPVELTATPITVPLLGMTTPVLVTHAPGDARKRLFVVERAGEINAIENEQVVGPAFWTGPVESTAAEQGLLGLAFDPDFQSNGRFFVAYTTNEAASTRIVVESYTVSSNPDVADYSSRTRLLELDDVEPDHNAGMLAFGPDGHLYFSSGDGGGPNDQHTDNGPDGNGQSLRTGFGKILRLHPSTGAPPCIWAHGLRNPWRFSFDRETGDMYIGDVGQDHWEEVDVAPRGHGHQNYGWRFMEGKHCTGDPETAPVPTSCAARDVGAFTPPVHDYPHANGNGSVIGGYVYRGSRIPSLRGYYVFGDWASRRIWAFVWSGTGTCAAPIELTAQLPVSFFITSFGEDVDGELYITTSDGSTGAAFRIDPKL